MKPIDKNTYGSSKAAEVLAKLIGDNRKYSYRVARCFQDFTTGILSIYTIRGNEKIKYELCMLWFEKHKARAMKSNLPEIIRTYLVNVEQTYIKHIVKFLKEKQCHT